MGFDQLPEFPQGGVARAESGNQGIPPESFVQGLQDAGSTLITSTKRPEDIPAVQAALTAEVDTLTQGLGLATPPAAPQPQAPARPPDTQRPAAGPAPSGDPAERIRQVFEKYQNKPEEFVKAYFHSEAARTRAQQDRANDIQALRQEVSQIGEMVRTQYARQSYATGPGSAPTATAAGPLNGNAVPDDPEEFFKKPKENFRALVDEVVTAHLSAYTDAQRQYEERNRYNALLNERKQDIERLSPLMDELYAKGRGLYDRLPRPEALDLLLERAREREEALRARAFYEEARQILGPNGTPQQPNTTAAAAPPQAGTLPGGFTTGRPAPGTPPNGDWSNTPTFNRLWKSRSDSTDEHMAVADILKERGFYENLP